MQEAANIDCRHMDEKALYCFLRSFSVGACRNSAEYSEYANDELFEILAGNAPAVIRMLARYPKINSSYLHSEIQRPLTDAHDIKRLIFVIDSANKESAVKKQIIADLEKALKY